MIFVTVGTSTFPFDRLLRGVDELGMRDDLVVQYGASELVPHASVARQFMSYADVLDHMRRAHAVIAHGGAGSILTALHAGKHPIVVPRRCRFSEAVDDHQLDLASRLASTGLVTLVDDVSELAAQVAAVPAAQASQSASSSLAAAISAFVESKIGHPSGSGGNRGS
jgi:UDP-N-acetylglucosamine transferase subunit ALG13